MKPVLQALILAERIYEDRSSGRKIIAGTITELGLIPLAHTKGETAAVSLPDGTTKNIRLIRGGIAGSPSVYISLTGVFDGTILGLQFVSLSKNKVLFGTDITLKCEDRLETIELALSLPELNLPGPGIYAFEVICEGEIIGSARIVAKDLAEYEKGSDSHTGGQ